MFVNFKQITLIWGFCLTTPDVSVLSKTVLPERRDSIDKL